jgi:hypothetical protein
MENSERYIKDVTERYIYQVVKRLPVSQREEIKKELSGLIEDMLAERSENPGKADIDAVLTELGRPSELADKYRDTKQHLIGPEYFALYTFVLKIVLGATALGMTIALAVGFATSPPENIGVGIGEFFSSMIMALVQAFAWLTLGFALVERYNTKKIKFPDDHWKPSDLPPVPLEKETIKRSEPIAAMVFILLVMILFNVAPQIFSVYVPGETLTIVPIFDLSRWGDTVVVFNFIFALGLAKEFIRLLFGRYNMKLAVGITVVNLLSLVTSIALLVSPTTWNPDLASTLTSIHAFGMASDFNLAYYLDLFIKVLVGLVILGFIVDTVTVFVRGVRSSVSERNLT